MNAPAIIPTAYAKRGFVYCVRDDASEAVKIGFSANPARRLSQLQTAHAGILRIVCVFDGVPATEASFHQHFAYRRIRGEWFRDDDGEVSTVLLMARGVQ